MNQYSPRPFQHSGPPPPFPLSYSQGSSQEKLKAQWVGVVWAEFVSKSIILVTTSKKYGYWRHEGLYTNQTRYYVHLNHFALRATPGSSEGYNRGSWGKNITWKKWIFQWRWKIHHSSIDTCCWKGKSPSNVVQTQETTIIIIMNMLHCNTV